MDGRAIGALQPVAFPVNFSSQRPRARDTPPELGDDKDAVLPNDSPLSAAGR
ncbi:hypothetical protein [Arthrobacter wenxiniae]|jgi:hypothetical protein|uniref:Uncharacterized protein n=1 Tax=Arthrobacter wenxiniae TaxID=2713570 RepID=A0A7Y7IHY6_9MICC|nr:hypothetical protein [Arthrobacter wenxiniae]NVM95809.1 hypothetical protein [Arthrobacter wenxiniae]